MEELDRGIADAFARERSRLWQICYRMTGSAADADDAVQDTFVRAVEHPPCGPPSSWRPWLVRVAVNLGRDALRRRRRSYEGPWLPAPVPTAALEPPPGEPLNPDGGLDTEARYELLESASFAFLLALEALTPQQRAVLLLRDVFDYSTREVALALSISEANVRKTLSRARRLMSAYDRRRASLGPADQARSRRALEAFLAALLARDAATIERLLAADVVSVQDGGGEVPAARRPVFGRSRVRRLFLGLLAKQPGLSAVELRSLNGLPAVIVRFEPGGAGAPRQAIVRCELDSSDRISDLQVVLAPRKLVALGRRGPAG